MFRGYTDRYPLPPVTAINLFTIVLLIAVILIALYGVILYNRLVNLKHNVSMAWSNIDVLLKQRHDELPKLVEVCKQYMSYERDTLEAVMRTRSMSPPFAKRAG